MSKHLQALAIRARTVMADGREKGQGTLEYVGIVIIAALLVAAIVAAIDPGGITSAVQTKINEIINAG